METRPKPKSSFGEDPFVRMHVPDPPTTVAVCTYTTTTQFGHTPDMARLSAAGAVDVGPR